MNQLSLAELHILDWITQNCHTPFLDVFMAGVSTLGDNGFIWILLGLVLAVFCKSRRKTGVEVLLALLFSLIFCNLLLKNMVDRIRPFELNTMMELLVHPPGDTSFPSGHTSAAFAAAAVFLQKKWNFKWGVLVLAILIALSRLYLYMHFPTDVIGGLVVGLLCGLLAVYVLENWLINLPPFQHLHLKDSE